MKVLFISRAYPPVVGGIENQNYSVASWLGKVANCQVIANRKGKKWLPIFIPWALVSSLWHVRKADVVLLGDGVVTPVAWLLKWFYPRKRIVCILHGLDITYDNALYQQLWVKRFFLAIDHFVAVSRSTAEFAADAGIKKNKITVIPNGIVMPDHFKSSKQDLSGLLNLDVKEKFVLLTIGRLVKRKGVAWFLKNVLIKLPDDYLYIIAGDGPEREEIVQFSGLPEYSGRVYYLGMVDEEKKALLFSSSDLFVQPNIEVPGDVEGFGITVIEAGSYGLPVLASDLQGLRDSVQEGRNGWRVPAGDSGQFVKAVIDKARQIRQEHDLPGKVIEYIAETFSYQVLIQDYLRVLTEDGKHNN